MDHPKIVKAQGGVSARTVWSGGFPLHKSVDSRYSLMVERPLPYIFVYRVPLGPSKVDDRFLIHSQSSYLVVEPKLSAAGVSRLIMPLINRFRRQFGAFLIVEVWVKGSGQESSDAVRSPRFSVFSMKPESLPSARLAGNLSKVKIGGRKASVVCCKSSRASAFGTDGTIAFISKKQLRGETFEYLGIEIDPIWRNSADSSLFPLVARSFSRQLSRALRQTAYEFVVTSTKYKPDSFHELGRRGLTKRAFRIDREIASIAESFDFVLLMTPVNVESAWEAFRRRKYLTTPKFRYRPLPHDPDLLLRRLYNLPIEKIEDPAVAQLFRLKRSELRRQATILSSRDTIQAFYGTLGLYSAPDKELVKTAKRILRTPTGEAAQRKRRTVDAKEFARFARIEANRYRKNYPYFNLPIEIRDDIHRGLMVSHGRLLIGSRFRTREQRMDALLQHEVGTHVVTYLNGQQQKFNILRVGLPNYEELQEGLAVLAEYLVDGLDLERLRVLAARVVVAQQFHQGRSFSNCFSTLVESYGFTTRSAFTITLRIFRGGGMLKDAVYLRGLSKLLTHLGSGGKIEELYVGKLSLNTLGIIRELMWRGIVAEASVYPEFLRRPKAVERLNLLSDLKDPISGLLASARRRLL